MEECAKTLPATCSAWTGTLALAKEQELPLRVPERTAGDAALHGSLHMVRRPGLTPVCAVIHHAMEGRGQKRPPYPCPTALQPAERGARALLLEATTECTRIVQVGRLLRQKRLKPQGDQVRPALSSRTRSGALGEERDKPAMKQSPPSTTGELLTVLVIRKMQTFHFKEQWAWALRARQGANHLHPVP